MIPFITGIAALIFAGVTYLIWKMDPIMPSAFMLLFGWAARTVLLAVATVFSL